MRADPQPLPTACAVTAAKRCPVRLRCAGSLGWEPPAPGVEYAGVIGLQIRRGDKYHGGARPGQDQLSDVEAFEQVFLPALQRVHARRGAEQSVIFLATDSSLIIKHVMVRPPSCSHLRAAWLRGARRADRACGPDRRPALGCAI